MLTPAAEVFSTGVSKAKPSSSVIAPLVAVSVASLAAMLPPLSAIALALRLAFVAFMLPPLWVKSPVAVILILLPVT